MSQPQTKQIQYVDSKKKFMHYYAFKW